MKKRTNAGGRLGDTGSEACGSTRIMHRFVLSSLRAEEHGVP